jgi:hypothetical protein
MRMDVDRVGMTLTDQNFQTTVLESPQPVLVAFTAEGMAVGEYQHVPVVDE